MSPCCPPRWWSSVGNPSNKWLIPLQGVVYNAGQERVHTALFWHGMDTDSTCNLVWNFQKNPQSCEPTLRVCSHVKLEVDPERNPIPIPHWNLLAIRIPLISMGKLHVSAQERIFWHRLEIHILQKKKKKVTCHFLMWIPHLNLPHWSQWEAEKPHQIRIKIVWHELDADPHKKSYQKKIYIKICSKNPCQKLYQNPHLCSKNSTLKFSAS